MAQVACVRCGNTAEGLASAPLPGRVGETIREQICSPCWREWLGMQVKVINEYRLSPAQPEHYDFLMAQLKAYLNLKD
jgi:Fe-S cluster biosynthesis and repair protein YggX